MSDPELTPAEEQVRRLLADARHSEPMPEAVVARLDRVLNGLASEPARSAVVTDLATRRRRVTRLLLAAAAVVVVGVGAGQLLDDVSLSGGSADSTSADSMAEGAAEPEADAGGAEAPESFEGQGGTGAENGRGAQKDRRLLTLRRDHLAVDAQELAAAYSVTTSDAAGVPGLVSVDPDTAAGAVCRAEAWGSGTFVAVRYGRTPAVLALRQPQGDTQVADLFLCGSVAPIRSLTLPAP